MADVTATENEFRSQLTSWLNGYFQAGNYPFETATNDVSVAAAGTHLFIDVVLWLNREAKLAFCLFELKTPETPVHDSALLENARVKANALGVKYFVTWNMQDLVIWEVKEDGRKHVPLAKKYETLYTVQTADDWYPDSQKEQLKERARELLADLARLQRSGRLSQVVPDERYFVKLLHDTAHNLFPLFQKEITTALAQDRELKKSYNEWALKQGIAKPEAEREAASLQAVYRLLTKILFYEAVRSNRPELPALGLPNVAPTEAQRLMRANFARARAIDWYAVFEDEFIDELPWPEQAVPVIADVLAKLEEFCFYDVEHDVIGAVFEQLIPYEERRNLGQYFTRENLVDFILGFCVQTAGANVFDPTCGTGTFLIRAYDRLQVMANLGHKKALPALWGNDIAHFPAALATINLFRQDLRDTANFPRVISRDFFDVTPGDVFPFPPPTGPTEPGQTINVAVPTFDAVVGNFPYIRQELIEKRVKGYKDRINAVLQRDWPDYVAALSGQADIYAFMFFHAAAFLKPGGRLGIVTSNAWLDTAYGFELQKFFLEKFKIVAVVESRCEPWFEQAAVNTVFTVLERCDDAAERDEHIAKFVKVKRPLAHLFPQDLKLERRERWNNINARVGVIERAGNEYYRQEGDTFINTLRGLKSVQNGDFRIRLRRQRELCEELAAAGRTVKWGQFLRAPDIYFEIKEALGDKLKPFREYAGIDRGLTTGINDFFYLTPAAAEERGIEKEYLIPVFKSPRDSENILIEPGDLKVLLFKCHETKGNLKKKRHTGALKYIEEGEGRRTRAGVPYPEVPSVRGNKPGWWAVRELEPAQIFFAKGYDAKLSGYFSEVPIVCDCRIYYLTPQKKAHGAVLAAVVNSSLTYLFKELIGRVMLGEGVLDIMVSDYDNYLEIPDLTLFDAKKRKVILNAFGKLKKRPVRPVPEEFKEPDRRAFDTAVLDALGLDAGKYLEALYAGVTELVGERLGLAAQRKKQKKARAQKDLTRVKEQVVGAALPRGFRPFPDHYLSFGPSSEWRNQGLGNGPFQLGAYFMGGREVLNCRGELMARAASEEEARYIMYSYQPEVYAVKIPHDAQKVHNAVVAHERYLAETFAALVKEFAARLQDVAGAERLAREVFDDYGVPLIFLRD